MKDISSLLVMKGSCGTVFVSLALIKEAWVQVPPAPEVGNNVLEKVGNVGQANYTASKAGVVALTKTSAKELARFGIRCNTILPGFIDTPMAGKVPEKVLDKVLQLVPMGRLGDPTGGLFM
ncbi:(3R)-3-hydroxyacyl-CoA dehydrogenase-like [Rhincodon typus]|uniref:(3R)-3-hydroxyacyl-CoA dehydrogenase-like n=1 Tax=Rhincodon typus TaxID=259920 RepID=UPI0020303D3B|nr:(3R)-3-hydroxyacyl-CoA dehydrogenase-like [Rhincodon typus]